MDAEAWEKRYRARDQMFSGRPNEVLVGEARDLPVGRALDVGCGEGADAIWLAQQGWEVLGVDVSPTALERAAAAAAAANVADLTTWSRRDTPAGTGAFDLVSAHYLPLPVKTDHNALRVLLECVAPGGTLLYVSHAPGDISARDAQDYYQPARVAELLGGGWRSVVNETRPRTAPAPAGPRHRRDSVLKAERDR